MRTIALVIGALIPTLAIVAAALWIVAKLREIHDLVNSRLKAALDKIGVLERKLGIPESDDN